MGKMTHSQRKRFLAELDLTRECPHCHARLPPAEQHHLDNVGTMLCPRCHQTFVIPHTAPSTS